MKTHLLTALALMTLTAPALAQGQMPGIPGMPGMMRGPQGQDMPGMGQPPTGSSPNQPATQPQEPMPMAQSMPGMAGMMGGQGGMMMMCPMMQGGMAGTMGGRGTGAMSNAAMRPGGDDSVPSLAFDAVTDKMHRGMAISKTGNVDADFAATMIAHHQGAIDMAKITLAFGKDPEIRKLAEDVVRAQEAEIATLRDWIARQPK